MKKTTYYLLMFSFFLFASCGSDDLEIQETTFLANNVNTDKEDPSEEQEKPIDQIDTPCQFDFSTIKAGQIIPINCMLDLEGEEINLPANVTLTFDKGDIINGTINFAGQGKIDGRLLNSSLKLTGNISLTDKTFQFIPSRWSNIVEGPITPEIALKNTAEFENLMFYISDLGGSIFEIDQFDAFFEVTVVTSTTSDQNFRPSKEAINIPSNFHLKMTDKTFIRMSPSAPDKKTATLIAVRDVENVIITGGNLIGDSLTRKYISETLAERGEEGGIIFDVHAARNIRIEGVTLKHGSAGGIAIYSLGFPFRPEEYIASDRIKVLNCTFENIRRMSMSVTDGNDVLIQGNTFKNTGQPVANSQDNGGNVGYAVNLETFRRRDEAGNLQEFQRVTNVQIRNNTEINSRIGFLLILGSSDVIAENNNIQTRIAFSFSNKLKIRNNNLIAKPGGERQKFAIFASGGVSEFHFDNQIYGNEISGYGSGLSLDTQKCNVYNNTISDCEVGVQITSSKELSIHDNTIGANNIGILSNITSVDDINIYKNTVNAKGFHVKFTQVNQDPEAKNYKVALSDNKFINETTILLSGAKGVGLDKNEIKGGITAINSSNLDLVSNTIRPDNFHGISLDGTHSNVTIQNNNIFEPTGAARFECINNESTSPNEITSINNSCL